MSRSDSMRRIFIPSIVLLLSCLCSAKPSLSVAPTTTTHYLDEILSYVNHKIDPCDDFYEYACGNWKPKQLDSSKEKNSLLMGLNNGISNTINSFLVGDNVVMDDVYPHQIKALRKYYQVCVESTEEPVKKSSRYLEVLKNIGGFPALDPSWVPETFDWIAMASHLNVFGCKNLLTEVVYPMFPFPFSFHKMELGIDVALNTKTFKNPKDFAYQINSEEMLKILRLYEVDDEKSQLVVKDILEFIKNIMEYNIVMSEIRSVENFSEFLITTEDSDDLYRVVLEKYMNIAWNMTNEEDINEITDYQSDFEKIIVNKAVRLINETKPEVVANYLSLKLLYYLHGDQELRTNNNKKFCTLEAMKINGYFTSLLYNSTISDEEQRSRSEDIIKLIKELLKSFEKTINSTSWLDKNTMEEAAEKISKIRINIGQVDDVLGDIVMKEMLKLNFSDDYERNFLELLKFRVHLTHIPFKLRDSLKNTTKPLEILSSAEVNAFYFVLDNSVYIPNGILNFPVYDKDLHTAVKYSRMGYILGHELFHAFDSIGRHFDARGDERNWWSNISESIYKEKSRCFKEELNHINIEHINILVNGNKTVDETLADDIGVAMAFDAFVRNVKEGEDQWCSEHGITKEQLFFLSFSQLYCGIYTKNHLLNELEDEHPSDHLRIQYSLSQSTKFSEHFQCKKGSKMNPEKKCKMF